MASFEKRGKKWRAIVSAIEHSKRVKKSKTFDTKKEATVWANQIESEKFFGESIVPKHISIPDYFYQWYTIYKAPDIRVNTTQAYMYLHHSLKKYFDHIYLDTLTLNQLQEALDDFGSTRSKTTVAHLASALKSSLMDAKTDGYINTDTFRRLKIRYTENGAPNKRFLSAKEFESMRVYLYDHINDPLNRTILIALETGARRGEILALTVDDIDFNNDIIHVNKSWTEYTKKAEKPKTPQSIRDIKVPHSFLLSIQPYLPESGDLFKTKYIAKSTSNAIKDVCEDLGIDRLRFHDLRHSHASYLWYKGVSIEGISKRLGHKDVTITLHVYAHMVEEKNTEIENQIVSIMDTKSPEVPND